MAARLDRAKEVLEAGMGRLTDVGYVKYAATFHKIVRRSLKLPGAALGRDSAVRFFASMLWPVAETTGIRRASRKS